MKMPWTLTAAAVSAVVTIATVCAAPIPVKSAADAASARLFEHEKVFKPRRLGKVQSAGWQNQELGNDQGVQEPALVTQKIERRMKLTAFVDRLGGTAEPSFSQATVESSGPLTATAPDAGSRLGDELLPKASSSAAKESVTADARIVLQSRKRGRPLGSKNRNVRPKSVQQQPPAAKSNSVETMLELHLTSNSHPQLAPKSLVSQIEMQAGVLRPLKPGRPKGSKNRMVPTAAPPRRGRPTGSHVRGRSLAGIEMPQEDLNLLIKWHGRLSSKIPDRKEAERLEDLRKERNRQYTKIRRTETRRLYWSWESRETDRLVRKRRRQGGQLNDEDEVTLDKLRVVKAAKLKGRASGRMVQSSSDPEPPETLQRSPNEAVFQVSAPPQAPARPAQSPGLNPSSPDWDSILDGVEDPELFDVFEPFSSANLKAPASPSSASVSAAKLPPARIQAHVRDQDPPIDPPSSYKDN